MKRFVSVLLVLFVLATGAKAFGQVGLFVGGFAGYSAQTPSFSGVTFNTDTKFLFGLRGGIRFLMLAAELNYFQAAHNITMTPSNLFNWNGKKDDYSYLGVNLKLFFLPLIIINPYVTAGYGNYTVDVAGVDKQTKGGYNFGLGLELALGKRVSLVAEGKYNHVTVDLSSYNVGVGDFTLTGGLNINF